MDFEIKSSGLIVIKPLLLPCVPHVDVDVEQYDHRRAPLRDKSLSHRPALFLSRRPSRV